MFIWEELRGRTLVFSQPRSSLSPSQFPWLKRQVRGLEAASYNQLGFDNKNELASISVHWVVSQPKCEAECQHYRPRVPIDRYTKEYLCCYCPAPG